MTHLLQGQHTITPYLVVHDAASAIAFYEKAFGAKELERFTDDEGKIGFARLLIGDSQLLLSDEYPGIGIQNPLTLGVTTVSINLYVSHADTWANRAIEAGAKVVRPVADQGNGIRTGIILCPFGHRWFITQIL